MNGHVVIIGGSIGGLAAALGLARQGCSATIVERDVSPTTDSGEEAFLSWDRRGVPQFRQPHVFSARSRNLLLERLPEVLDRLADDGIEASNMFKLVAPPEVWTAEDEAFTGLITRRPAFELALRRQVEVDPAIEIVSPAAASGLLFAPEKKGWPLQVTGVRLADGRDLDADMVLDCGGRRTPVPRWLMERGVEVPVETQDCDVTYYTRYYRLHPGSMLSPIAALAIRAELGDGVMTMGFPGDKNTFAVLIATLGDDDALRVLRHSWAWEAAAARVPTAASWIDPANAEPIHDVQVMAGHQNARRHYVVDGAPLVLGLLPVGDSLCTTNPTYGWGSSMALTYAFAAVDAIRDHEDRGDIALAYDAAVVAEADGVYRESAAMDRYRLYRARNIEVPAHDADEMDRQDLIALGVGIGARRDPVLGRAFLRRANLIDSPAAVLDDHEVFEHAIAMREVVRAEAAAMALPNRDDLLAAVAVAAADPVRESVSVALPV